MSRRDDFDCIKAQMSAEAYCATERAILFKGDAIEVLRHLPPHSVSLILTDPPYHTTKKSNIVNDKSFASDGDFLGWMEGFAKEWKRVLRPNGSLFMFCSSAMEARLEVMLSSYFNVLSHIVWTKPNEPGYDGWKGKMKKEALRQWYPYSERIIFCEPAREGNMKRSYFGALLREKRAQCNLSGHKLTEMVGAFGKVNHGGAVSNWETGRNIPSRAQYDRICKALEASGLEEAMPPYEDVIRPFEVNVNVEFTDVWSFPSVRPYKGKHPAEKPLELLAHCITSTTFEDDIVLDCFAGSGNTMFAALLNGRQAVGVEIDAGWCDVIRGRLLSLERCKPDKLVGSQDAGRLQMGGHLSLF